VVKEKEPIKEHVKEDFLSHLPVRLVDEIIIRAHNERASDIHIEPWEHECRVRIRIDGDLVQIGRYKKEIHDETIARLKVLSSLRTDIRTVPQDGRFKVTVSGASVSIRISVVPTFLGEKAVLRLLPQTSNSLSLKNLGFNELDQKKIFEISEISHGMILVVGPTGSGKTTTLYALLQKISKPNIATVTLEDPIEFCIPGITQIPIHGGGAITFASALRAVVRQDPDVIMLGEIRDVATAELSVHAALTGHLVLSTLHTNDAVTGLLRLIDMEVEPFLVASTVRAIISQRLVRKICPGCIQKRNVTRSDLEFIEKSIPGFDVKGIESFMCGRGCNKCRGSGYLGRTVITETLVLDERIRELVMQKATSGVIKAQAIQSGMVPIVQDAIEKMISGKTTIEEIASHCHDH
jgi:type II secretory ATPase GspE/PulE/Tfp pilus assembly ATPase PilB-like protein